MSNAPHDDAFASLHERSLGFRETINPTIDIRQVKRSVECLKIDLDDLAQAIQNEDQTTVGIALSGLLVDIEYLWGSMGYAEAPTTIASFAAMVQAKSMQSSSKADSKQ